MVTAIREQWNDETLQEERDMYGERWSIGAIYGPSREEWSRYGMEAPAV